MTVKVEVKQNAENMKTCGWCGHSIKEGEEYIDEGGGGRYEHVGECWYKLCELQIKLLKEDLKPINKKQGQRSLSDFKEVFLNG